MQPRRGWDNVDTVRLVGSAGRARTRDDRGPGDGERTEQPSRLGDQGSADPREANQLHRLRSGKSDSRRERVEDSLSRDPMLSFTGHVLLERVEVQNLREPTEHDDRHVRTGRLRRGLSQLSRDGLQAVKRQVLFEFPGAAAQFREKFTSFVATATRLLRQP